MSTHKKSFRLRSKYLEQLSEGTYVPTLFLAVVRELYLDTERPVDLSKMTFDKLDVEEAEDEESKVQANTAFVFSQALNYASAPVRTEWFDLRDRLLQERIQKYHAPLAGSNSSYVAKFFSNKIISNELSTIKATISQAEYDDENVEIRVNEITKEINSKYQVEEGQKNEMSIRLPPSYPLAEVEIVGNSRVGVTQDRWNKWILTCKIACKVQNPF
jgi:E3 ubiquitin-protein ligase listerin